MKKVFYGIIALILLYFILCFAGPDEVKAERTITISAPAPVIREKLGDFGYFHHTWSPWTEKDPDMKTSFTGHPGEPGHLYSWSGNSEVGTGKMELLGYSGDSLLQKVSFEDQGEARSYFIIDPQEDGAASVTWGMTFDVGFLYRTPMLFFNMDEMIGKDYENGLARLKLALEAERSARAGN